MGEMTRGCSNHGCPFTASGGMKTNGTCHCLDDVRRTLGVRAYTEIQSALATAKARAGAADDLAKALIDYGTHLDDCSFKLRGRSCDCGWPNALDLVDKHKAVRAAAQEGQGDG